MSEELEVTLRKMEAAAEKVLHEILDEIHVCDECGETHDEIAEVKQ